MSLPADPVLLDANVADELSAAAGNALDNAAAHAGPDAQAFVLLEDLGDSVTVSIATTGSASRTADSRKRSARAASVLPNRLWDVELAGRQREAEYGPGCGTEWNLTIPRR